MPYTYIELKQELFDNPRPEQVRKCIERLEENYNKGDIEGVRRCASQLLGSDVITNYRPEAVSLLQQLAQTGMAIMDPEKKGKHVTEVSVSPGSQAPGSKSAGSVGRTAQQSTTMSQSVAHKIPEGKPADIGSKTMGAVPLNTNKLTLQQHQQKEGQSVPGRASSPVEAGLADHDSNALLYLLKYLQQFVVNNGNYPAPVAVPPSTERIGQGYQCVQCVVETLRSQYSDMERTARFEQAMNKSDAENMELKRNLDSFAKQLQDKDRMLQNLEENTQKTYADYIQAKQYAEKFYKEKNEAHEHIGKLEKKEKKREEQVDKLSQNVRDLDYDLKKSQEEVNKLRTRLSKIAGEKMNEGNSEVTDLSDPQRPMKLSDEFGGLYDDEWTDCFVALTEKFKRSPEEAIKYLLCVLQDSFEFCNQLQFQQLDSLKNVLLYPDQSVDPKLAQKTPNRIHSREMNELLKLRRQISSTSEVTIVQQFLQHAQKQMNDKKEESKVMGECLPYYTKCVQICWLMVLHNPPLYMKFDAKAGDAFDMNLYREYGQSGDKFQFLVWPPLFVEKDGGLLSKGVAQPVGKKSKKR